eukprot:s1349_g13.t1
MAVDQDTDPTAYLDSLVSAGLEDDTDEESGTDIDDQLDDQGDQRDSANDLEKGASDCADLQVKVNSLIRQICGDPVERSNEVCREPPGAGADDQAILEGTDRADLGNDQEIWSDRPPQVPPIPPYWPIPLLPSSAINSELRRVVNASDFQPADFFTLASYLLQQRLRRLLRRDDVVIHHLCGQWVMRVNELQMELMVHADDENMAKQLLYAMLAFRLKLGGGENTVGSGKKKGDKPVGSGKKKGDKHAAVGTPKNKEGNSTSGGRAATKKLVDDMIHALESDVASRPFSIGSLAAVAADNDNSKTTFGVRFRRLHRGKFKSWVEKNVPGITVHPDNTLSFWPQSSGRSRSRSRESYRRKKKSRC